MKKAICHVNAHRKNKAVSVVETNPWHALNATKKVRSHISKSKCFLWSERPRLPDLPPLTNFYRNSVQIIDIFIHFCERWQILCFQYFEKLANLLLWFSLFKSVENWIFPLSVYSKIHCLFDGVVNFDISLCKIIKSDVQFVNIFVSNFFLLSMYLYVFMFIFRSF